jgi:hypothetical protein
VWRGKERSRSFDEQHQLALDRSLRVSRSSLRCDVAGNLGRADDHARGITDRRHGKRDRHEPAVLRPSFRLVTVDAFAAADAVQNRGRFVRTAGRRQYRHRPPDGLFGCVTEHALSAAVPAADNAVQILADDGIVGRLDDGGKPLVQVVRRHLRHHADTVYTSELLAM